MMAAPTTAAPVVVTTSSSSTTFADNVAYIVLGSITACLNLLIFAVLISDKTLLRRSALLAGIALGNLFLGINLFSNGIYRINAISTFETPATIANCVSLVFPLLYQMGFNTEACFLILAGLERFLAIHAHNWFRKAWTSSMAWKLALGACGLVITILVITLTAPIPDRAATTWQCGLSMLYGSNYIKFSSLFSCLAGLTSATFTVVAYILCVRRMRKLPLASGEAGRVRKQLQLTKSMITISCFEVALMAIPNFLSLLGNFRVPLPSFIRPSNSSYTNAVNSMVAFFAFVAFNSNFRKAAIQFLRLQKLASALSQAKMTPVNITTVARAP